MRLSSYFFPLKIAFLLLSWKTHAQTDAGNSTYGSASNDLEFIARQLRVTPISLGVPIDATSLYMSVMSFLGYQVRLNFRAEILLLTEARIRDPRYGNVEITLRSFGASTIERRYAIWAFNGLLLWQCSHGFRKGKYRIYWRGIRKGSLIVDTFDVPTLSANASSDASSNVNSTDLRGTPGGSLNASNDIRLEYRPEYPATAHAIALQTVWITLSEALCLLAEHDGDLHVRTFMSRNNRLWTTVEAVHPPHGARTTAPFLTYSSLIAALLVMNEFIVPHNEYAEAVTWITKDHATLVGSIQLLFGLEPLPPRTPGTDILHAGIAGQVETS